MEGSYQVDNESDAVPIMSTYMRDRNRNKEQKQK